MERRAYLAAVVGAVSLGGCSTSSGSEPFVESGSGEFEHDIVVHTHNIDREANLTITASRLDGEQIYEEQHTVPAGVARTVAGITEEEDPRPLIVNAVDSRGNSTRADVSVSDCLGDVNIEYTTEGDLEPNLTVC